MKISAIILKYGLIAWALTVISCDKQETETNFPKEAVLEEGFMSTTENFDSEIEVSSQEPLSPLLHIRYDAALSQEEVEAKFQTEVSKLEKEVGPTNKTSSYFNFTIITRTGTGTHNETDGNVKASVVFKTDKGLQHRNEIVLNNVGDDRERGSWDIYYFGTHMPRVSWIEALIASIAIQGTDGWYLSRFIVQAYPYNQYVASSESTYINSHPYTWLDNTTSSGYDYYNTGAIGQGRLTFE